MGRVWERLIRSVRKILSALLSEQTLTDEGPVTLMIEVEAILNPCPLTPVTLDPKDDELFTQTIFCFKLVPQLHHQVFLQRTIAMFVDVGGKYSVQQLADGARLPRSPDNWQTGCVCCVFPDSRNIVQVEANTANETFRRPIAKLCLVCRGDEKNHGCYFRLTTTCSINDKRKLFGLHCQIIVFHIVQFH